MADPDRKVLSALVRLLSNPEDPSDLTDEELVEAVREAREARAIAEGRAAAELNRRGWTWERIGKAMGVNTSTVYRWAAPYRSS